MGRPGFTYSTSVIGPSGYRCSLSHMNRSSLTRDIPSRNRVAYDRRQYVRCRLRGLLDRSKLNSKLACVAKSLGGGTIEQLSPFAMRNSVKIRHRCPLAHRIICPEAWHGLQNFGSRVRYWHSIGGGVAVRVIPGRKPAGARPITTTSGTLMLQTLWPVLGAGFVVIVVHHLEFIVMAVPFLVREMGGCAGGEVERVRPIFEGAKITDFVSLSAKPCIA
jgi:hypothetical protein